MTFLNPLFLLGTLLAAIPVLIHLWFRKRLKKISFPTLRFLKRTEARRFGWLRLRELLILAMRCLFVVFLFLGLARPQLSRSAFSTGRLASVCIFIDDSYSMAYGENFERMKERAVQVIGRYSKNSEFFVARLCARSPRPSWVTKESALRSVRDTELTFRDGNIHAAVADAPLDEARYAIEYVYVGDGQAVNFTGFEGGLPVEGPFYAILVPSGSNAGISNVSVADPVMVPRDEYTLRVAVVNHSARVWSGTIRVSAGAYSEGKSVQVQPRSEAECDLSVPVHDHTGKVELLDDSLRTDNVYYFNKRLPRNINVLVVGDNPYIVRALNLGTGSNATADIRFTESLGNEDLRRYDLLVLGSPTDISETEAMRLIDHLRRSGSGLVVVLHERTGPLLKKFLSPFCRVFEPVIPKGYVTVDWVDVGHPIFTFLDDIGALRDVQCYQYVKIGSDTDVISRFSNGDPFIIAGDNVAVISARLDEQSTNFVFHRSFVPIILRLATYVVLGDERKEYHVGDAVTQSGYVKAPSGEFLQAGDEFLVPGFYVSDGETLCVNVLPQEGDLQTLGVERARFFHVEVVDPAHYLAGSDLSSLFLLLAFLSLLLELSCIWLR